LKNVLIISPYFPPVNGADMHRVRMCLSYFNENGWEAEVVAVEPQYTDLPQDELLLKSIPANTKVHYVKAWDKNRTSKLGLGSLAIRSMWYYRQAVNRLLNSGKFDMVYFSTTQFPLCVLGRYWKRRFGIPYVIDMQDPWHSEYYQDKPKAQQPSKYWLSYRLNKYLEPVALKTVGGLISVSDDYIQGLKTRYPELDNVPSAVITFAAFKRDLEIAVENATRFEPLLKSGFKNIVYVGRGGMDLYNAIKPLFDSVKKGLTNAPALFNNLKLYFIGTSYAPNECGEQTIMPLAKACGVENHVIEITDRIGYYHTLFTLQQADALFIPGSDDPAYTASKIFPYLLTNKLLLCCFNSGSSVIEILKEYGASYSYTYDTTKDINDKIYSFIVNLLTAEQRAQVYNEITEEKYSARNMTKRQCELFDQVLHGKN
jgi:hypothetical protein